ncbi:phage protein GemA/Gp16 family protein [Helicobacter muridarum]|uniref:phage protein GemA/Gp16 family protein n=1 Tax=Helicobacter muridarum TaxID=216 RepID=UPI002278B0D9|nr:phage protein GemA/Gp16 family protein [Helicobacter muridarum]
MHVRYGVESSKDLSIKELWEVLDIFNGKKQDRDYCLKDSIGRAQLLPLRKKSISKITKNQALMIEDMLNIVRYNDIKAKEFFKKQTKRDIESIENLSKSEATKVIIGLRKIAKWDKSLKYINNMDYRGQR